MSTSEISRHMITKLIELHEYKLALRVVACDVKTEILSLQSQRLQRKMTKHNARVAKQENAVDQLADDIPRIIMSHQKN